MPSMNEIFIPLWSFGLVRLRREGVKELEGEPPGEPSPQKSSRDEARREPRPPDLERV